MAGHWSSYRRSPSGFTLLELVIVFLVIGIIAGTALVTYSPPPFKEERGVLEKLRTSITTAQEKAILDGIPMGILFFTDRYLFLQISGRSWVESELSGETIDLQAARLLIDNLSVFLPRFGQDEAFFPQVVFLPSAEVTEFELEVPLSDGNNSILFTLKSDVLGRAILEEF